MLPSFSTLKFDGFDVDVDADADVWSPSSDLNIVELSGGTVGLVLSMS